MSQPRSAATRCLGTVSIGVAALRIGMHDLDGLLSRADTALYQAKEAGRDRVVAFGDEIAAAAPRRSRRSGRCRSTPQPGITAQRLGADARPSAVAITRKTRVLSMRPRKSSAPGPIAVSTTSSAACTPAFS